MCKRSITFLLVFLLLFSNTTTSYAKQVFKDVGNNHSAKAEIEYLATESIISGYPNGNFGINDNITRLQASAMIVRALKLDTNNRPNPNLKDVTPNSNGYGIISTVVAEGIMTGNTHGEFKPSDKLTRAQMAAILVRAFKLQGETAYSFKDVSYNHWASPSIRILMQNGVTTGYSDNTFKPNNPITRAHFAVFLARVLNDSFKKAPPAPITKPGEPVLNIDIQIGADNGMTREEMLKIGKEFATDFRVKSLKDKGYTNVIISEYAVEYVQAANEEGRFLYTASIFASAIDSNGVSKKVTSEIEVEVIKIGNSFETNYERINFELIY